jgi:hypothetical protein
MSHEIKVHKLVTCPITGELQPYECCRRCVKYREELRREEFRKELDGDPIQFKVIAEWCDYE